jgi:hypothetical protein
MDSEGQTKFLDSLAKAAGKFVIEDKVGLIWTAHANDEGQTRDSRMIAKAASIRLNITRDHMNDDNEIKNTTHISVYKNRENGPTGYGGSIYFNTDNFTYEEGAANPGSELPF